MPSTALQDFGQPLVLEDYKSIQQPVTTSSPPLCATCHTPASLQRCSTCKSMQYCSPGCQTRDWPSHRLLCKPLLSAQDTRPTPSHRRALYLPGTSSKPHFIWLQYGADGFPLDRSKCFPTTPTEEIKTIAFHNRFLPHWTQISYDSNTSRRLLNENDSVKRLLGGSSGAAKWRGPLVVLAYSVDEGLAKPALDVDTSVLGPLVEYLRLRGEYEGPVFVEQPQERWGEVE
ncbi:hypothetical protein EJ07DRAFT_130339 [Lizonia empirigonia]|nr:hypothetical protein EJ07DRAFT_130339 [Lizonia empirigonia]